MASCACVYPAVGEEPVEIARAVVRPVDCHYMLEGDPEASEEGEAASHELRAGALVFVRVEFRVGGAGEIVYGDVGVPALGSEPHLRPPAAVVGRARPS